MTDTAAPAPAPAVAADPILKFSIPNIEGEHSFDVTTVPGDARLQLLKGAIRDYIRNRVNSTFQRHAKDEKVVAWSAYDEAVKADPLQSAVAKPEGDRPAAADLAGSMAAAIEALTKGDIGRRSGEGTPRERKDPLTVAVTKAVVRDLFDATKLQNPKYTYLQAQKDVGTDGVAYLNARIDTMVEAGADRAPLEKMRDEKYVKPMRIMLGLDVNKTLSALPSLF